MVLKNVLKSSDIKKIKKIVYDLAKLEERKNQSYIYKFDKNKTTIRVWNLVNKHAVFRKLIQNKDINNFMNWIFNRKTHHQKYYLSSFQANILKPGAESQKLHIDTPVPEPLPVWPIKANSIWMIDDFSNQNGATELLPRSHKKLYKPKKKDNKRRDIISCTGNAGSVIITHGALWHRAGSNKSKMNRIALLGSFAASYAREIANEEDHSIVIDNFTKKKSTKFLKKILGIGHGIKKGSQIIPRKRN